MLRRLAALVAGLCALVALPQLANAAPTPVPAFYMYGTTLSALQSNAYSHGCTFAQHHPGGFRLLMLDFGGARKIDANTWGALDFSGVRFSNPDILSALESAANGHHNCWTGTGDTTIAYGNSNYHMSSSGMTSNDAYYTGYYQSQRSQDLYNYQQAHGYNHQSSDAGSDMELDWDSPGMTKQMVNGDYAQGWALYFDYGDAAGCPSSGSSGSCNNGWTVADVAYKSFHGLAFPLPEIYYTVNADQWTVVRRNYGSGYSFWGTTGEISSATGHLTPAGGWNALASRNSGLVGDELICFGC